MDALGWEVTRVRQVKEKEGRREFTFYLLWPPPFYFLIDPA